MTSHPATPSNIAGSGQDANGDSVESLRWRLHEAEHTITGLKATQDFVVTQNADLKKEHNQLREEMAVFRCQKSLAGTASNEVTPGASVTMSPQDLKKLQGILQEVKRHGSELHQKAGELRDSVLLKQEEFNRKRRRTDSDTDRNEEENLAMQFVKACKRYNQTTGCDISFNGALKLFIEDLSRVYESESSLHHKRCDRIWQTLLTPETRLGGIAFERSLRKADSLTLPKAFPLARSMAPIASSLSRRINSLGVKSVSHHSGTPNIPRSNKRPVRSALRLGMEDSFGGDNG